MTAPTFKPCPFCGGQAEIDFFGGSFSAVCRSCACEGPHASTEYGAVRLWNMRVYEKRLQRLIERVALLESTLEQAAKMKSIVGVRAIVADMPPAEPGAAREEMR